MRDATALQADEVWKGLLPLLFCMSVGHERVRPGRLSVRERVRVRGRERVRLGVRVRGGVRGLVRVGVGVWVSESCQLMW